MILALDAGGTSTRCVLAGSNGMVRGCGRGGPGNHMLSAWDAARGAIREAISQACAAAGVDASAITCAFAGSAGVGPNGEGCEVITTLLGELLPRARVGASGDMVTAFTGALDSDAGVVVAAGTGSVCYGRNASGASRQVGGWGHILGDEGSAYDIAARALRAGARATDGRGPQTTLTERLSAALQVNDFIQVALRVYGEPLARDAIAALATTVAEAAAAGDSVARDVLCDAGHELGLAAVTALRILELIDSAAPVAYTGAVFDAGEPVLGSFRRTILSACPRAAVVAAEFPPVIGAFKLALRELGIAFTPAIAAALRRTLASEMA